tara:strand:- start:4602 stop:5192 length:591 start_codon:yes stop_codon:yes gene_type:complete
MGGIGSGRQRYRNRGAVEDHPALDLRILKRLQLLMPGECTYDVLRWSNGGLSVAEARIFVDLEELHSAQIKIHMQVADNSISQHIDIEADACGLGGHRYYMICPINGTRNQILYWCNDQFASRQAHALTYRSQTSTELSRARKRTAKLHSHLKGNDGFKRPRGRRRYSLVQKLNCSQREERALMTARAQGYFERKH